MFSRASFAVAVAAACLAAGCLAATPRWVDPGVTLTSFAANVDGSAIIVSSSGRNSKVTRDRGKSYTPLTVVPPAVVPQLEPFVDFLPSPNDSTVIYASVSPSIVGAALYRSDDAGLSWRLMNSEVRVPASDPSETGVSFFEPGAAPDLVYGSRVHVSCFIGCFTLTPVEALRSDDGGRTWTSIQTPDLQGERATLHPSASNAAVVYASTTKGIFRSDDRGGRWRLVRSATTPPRIVVDRVDPLTVYIQVDEATGVLASEDGGTTWRSSEAGPVPGVSWRLLADPVVAGRVFMMGADGDIYESRDRARSWFRAAPRSDVFNLVSQDPLRNDYSKAQVVTNGAGRLFLGIGYDPPWTEFNFRALDLPPDDFYVGSDFWWDPNEAGSGLTITQHGSGQVFMIWYTFDFQGHASWFSMSGGEWTDARTITGTLYTSTGPPFIAGEFDATKVKTTAIGTATLRFEDRDHAVYTYRIDAGVQGEKRIKRFLFGPKSTAPAPFMSDLWWKPGESGWGLALARQYSTVFAILFAYDANGRPTWYTAPGFTVTPPFNDAATGTGDFYSVTGPSSLVPFNPALVKLTKVGTANLQQWLPPARGVVFNWTVDGQSVTRALTPLPF